MTRKAHHQKSVQDLLTNKGAVGSSKKGKANKGWKTANKTDKQKVSGLKRVCDQGYLELVEVPEISHSKLEYKSKLRIP